jgi:replication factor C subunit 1
MFTDVYCPRRLSDYIGAEVQKKSFAKWLLEWSCEKQHPKCALVYGQNGIGKSLLVSLVLRKFNYHVTNLSGDEVRHDEPYKEYIERRVRPLLNQRRTFDGQNNVLVVSDVDSCTRDHGFIASLTDLIRQTEIPIICIADDKYNQSIKPLLKVCQDFKLSKPAFSDVYPMLYRIVVEQKIRVGKSMLEKMYERANGDIRFLLNNLQLYTALNGASLIHSASLKKDLQQNNIFDTTSRLLSQSTPLEEKYSLYWSAHDIHTLMIQENYVGNTLLSATDADNVKKQQNLSYSADALSDADLFEATFQNELEPYVAYQTVRATAKCGKRSQVKFSQFLGKISTINRNKADHTKDYRTDCFVKQICVKDEKKKSQSKEKSKTKKKSTK